jgi:hypothetical protein
MPITWRNVDAPSTAGVGRTLESASNSVNGAFDIFSKIIQQREGFNANQVAKATEAQKQGYLSNLQSAGTPEQLAAMEDSLRGEFTRLPPEAQAAARPAFEARMNQVRQNVSSTQAYDAGQAAIALKPLQDQIGAASSLGTVEGFTKARELANQIPEGQGRAAVLNGITLAERGRLVQDRADTTYNDDRTDRERTLRNQETADAEAERVRAEAARVRGVEGRLNAEIGGYQEGALVRQQEAEPLFQAFDQQGVRDAQGNPLTIPRNADGTVNFGAMGTGLRSQLEMHLAQNNSYTLGELEGSDTMARRNAVNALRSAGATPVDLARLDPVLAAGFNTTPQALTGNDLAQAERNQRIEDASMEQAASQFVPLSNPSAASEVANTVFAAIDQRFGGSTWRAEKLRRAADNFLKEGIVAKDEKGKPIPGQNGQPIKVIPSSETMLRLLSTMDENVSWFGLNSSASDLETKFKEYLKDPAVYRGAAASVDAQLRRSIRSINSPAQIPPR